MSLSAIFESLNLTKDSSFWDAYNISSEDWDYFDNYSNHNPIVTTIVPPLHVCEEGLVEFRRTYAIFHGYASLIVSILGTIANVLNILVLTRREMLSPTNAILTGLAVADGLVMVEYIPFTFYMYILNHNTPQGKFSYGWAVYVLFHSTFAQVFHTIAIGLTILLAVWRYMTLTNKNLFPRYSQNSQAYVAIFSTYILGTILCIPVYFMFEIRKVQHVSGLEAYVVGYRDSEDTSDMAFEQFTFWTYSVFIKLVPCVILTAISFFLIKTLSDGQKRNERLKKQSPMYQSKKSGRNINGFRLRKESKTRLICAASQAKRTTRMLLAILILFLMTELPQGILGLLSGVLGKPFFTHCYQNLAEVMDSLALVNSSINFILYCCMSSQFRKTFRQLFQTRVAEQTQSIHMMEGSPTKTVVNNTNTTHVTML